MKEETFLKLKNHEFNNGLRLSHVASFAIWNNMDINNPDIIERSIDRLKGNYVFVALNFSQPLGVWGAWKNFHCVPINRNGTYRKSSGDTRLRSLLKNTKFEGAYMTDIIKNYVNPNAQNVMGMQIGMANHIQWFIEEINLLSADNIEMYLFGEAVERIFHDNIQTLYLHLSDKVRLCQRIEHFSPSATNFPSWAPVQLGLEENNVGATIHAPVWGL